MNKGITLIETVVAVTVLIMALGGPFLLAAKSLHSAGYAREEIAASRLAEEGLEVIHNMRDNNAAESDAGKKWDDDMTSCTNGCVLDIAKLQNVAEPSSIWVTTGTYHALISCGGSECTGEQHRVYRHTSGLYRQFNLSEYGGVPPTGYTPTQMTRIIKINAVGGLNNREYLVQSIVTYMAGNQLRTITLSDSLMNWFPSMSTLL